MAPALSPAQAAQWREASSLHRAGRRVEAIALFQQLLEAVPALAEGWYEFGYLLKADGRYSDALLAFQRALDAGIERPEEVHLNCGVIWSDHLRDNVVAEREFRAALALQPDYVPALLNLGNLHEERGDREGALAVYAQLLAIGGELSPQHHDLRLEGLARSAKMRKPSGPDDPVFAALESAAASVRVDKTVRANLLFALGDGLDRVGDYPRAFDAFARANRVLLRQQGRVYDPSHSERLFEGLRAVFSDAPPVAMPQGDGGAQPLFICGMFRSGSTLVEQVLAAHPQVTPGGELDFLMRLAAERLAPFPESARQLDDARCAGFADEYRQHLATLFPQAAAGTYISDKRPDNFLLVGLIKRLFPAAKIIHSVRHPLDVGLSIYAQHLHLRVAGYSADLADIGHYLGQHQRLMQHWKSLYGDSIFDFDYDAFVREPEPNLRALLAFLGLPWDDACLSFHRLTNPVKTASYWQVRNPLHRGSSGRWRNYAAELRPLRAALEKAGVVIPD